MKSDITTSFVNYQTEDFHYFRCYLAVLELV